MFLSTEEIEKYTLNILEPIKEKVTLEGIYFSDNTNNEGLYIFFKNNAYHYVVSERGVEIIHLITMQVYEIIFWIIESIISTSIHITKVDLSSNIKKSQREIKFDKMNEIFKEIGGNYYKLFEIYVDEILRLYP